MFQNPEMKRVPGEGARKTKKRTVFIGVQTEGGWLPPDCQGRLGEKEGEGEKEKAFEMRSGEWSPSPLCGVFWTLAAITRAFMGNKACHAMKCGESEFPNVSITCFRTRHAERETIQSDGAVLKSVPSINVKRFCLPEMLMRKINSRAT